MGPSEKADLRPWEPGPLAAEQVDQYAAFVHASADDVVDKALNDVFSKDHDFQGFLKTPRANHVSSTLRVRKGPNEDAKDEAEQAAKKLGVGMESTASVRAVKARSALHIRAGARTVLRTG